MSNCINTSNYTILRNTWSKQPIYSLNQYNPENEQIKENFGSFSISAAVRPSNCNGNCNCNCNCNGNCNCKHSYNRHLSGVN